jgi:hypothetical protein
MFKIMIFRAPRKYHSFSCWHLSLSQNWRGDRIFIGPTCFNPRISLSPVMRISAIPLMAEETMATSAMSDRGISAIGVAGAEIVSCRKSQTTSAINSGEARNLSLRIRLSSFMRWSETTNSWNSITVLKTSAQSPLVAVALAMTFVSRKTLMKSWQRHLRLLESLWPLQTASSGDEQLQTV